MTPERWNQIKEILASAAALPPADRAAYLAIACDGDEDLRHELDSLLASHDAADSFLDTPASGFVSAAVLAQTAATEHGDRFGAYQIVGELGHGGMADVFAAVRADGQYEQRVALKLVRAGFSGAAIVERFRAERQILASLDHPNVARLLDGGTTASGLPYLVMELVDGTPIDAFCDTQALSIPERLRLFLQVCAAVEYAHRRLVIHRDLKPANILVTAGGVPKLLDFGIAKLLDPVGNVEETSLRPFTPAYASPEQVRGEAVSTASDVYSLGVVLYRLLTGRSPYGPATRTTAELAHAIVHEDAERPSAAAPPGIGLRGDLDDILLKALRKEPEQRYGSVERFADDVRRHLDGLPVLARAGTWSYRAGKFVRRHRGSVMAASLVLLSLVIGIFVTAREARIAEANRRRAETRFNDVRKLATSLIFEIHDSLQTIPGAIDVRKLILQRSVEYLDGLAQESSSEPELMRELAVAYARIGALEGNPFNINLGQSREAETSFRKSIALLEPLAATHPLEHGYRVDLAQVYLEYGQFLAAATGDAAAGFAYEQRTVAILDDEARRAPNDTRVLTLQLEALTGVGMLEAGNGLVGRVGSAAQGVTDMQRALELTRAAISRSPADDRLRYREGTIELVICEALISSGDRMAAVTYAVQGIQALKPLADRGDATASFNHLVALGKIGDALLIEGRAAESIDHYRDHLREAERLRDADPHNRSLQREQTIGAAQLGHALLEINQLDEGSRHLRNALTMVEGTADDTALSRSVEALVRGWMGEALERQSKIGEASRQYAVARRRLAELRAGGNHDLRILGYYTAATVRLAGAQARLGETEAASRLYEESRTLLEPVIKTAEIQELSYVLLETYAAEGKLAAERAGRADRAADRLADWQQAAASFRKSADIWTTIPHPARISSSGFEVTTQAEVSAQLARCEHEINALGGE